MTERGLALVRTAALAAGVLWLAAPDVATQASRPAAPPAPMPTAPVPGWRVPKTPDGHPDFQGYWTTLSFTPLERPEKFGTREFLTDQELDQMFKAGIEHSYEFTFANSADTPVYDATVYSLDAWQNGVRPNRRTSLIVDPPNGRLPELTPQAKAERSRAPRESFDGPENLNFGLRCFGVRQPPIPTGSGYNRNAFIHQSKDHFLIEYEWESATRLIPLDGRPHLSPNIRPWRGDPRGRWEGNTLVVESTNFRPEAAPEDGNARTMRMIERFTRLDENTIEYKYTVDDPSTWTKPWTVILPLARIDGPLFEYACHEGNNGLVNILEGARNEEKRRPESR